MYYVPFFSMPSEMSKQVHEVGMLGRRKRRNLPTL